MNEIPTTRVPLLQHLLETYGSEIQKIAFTWSRFDDADLAFRPHPSSSTVAEIMQHELLSGRRFFAEFLGLNEPAAAQVLPADNTSRAFVARLIELAQPRLAALAEKEEAWWLEEVTFFDVRRQRVWIAWRRILHSAHHRTQLTVYLRLLGKPVPAIYGPSKDETWAGADPTTTIEAAGR